MEINYSFADTDALLSVPHLWSRCFGDSEEYVKGFIGKGIAERYAIASVEGKCVGMTVLIPCVCGSVKCYYIYALCVLPEYRKRGIARGLLEFAFSYVREKCGGGLILRPAEESLFGYYGSLGFDVPVWGQVSSFSRHMLEAAAPISADGFVSLRKGVADVFGLVRFEPAWIKHCYEDVMADGGFCVKAAGDYFLGMEKESDINIIESSFAVSLSDRPVGLGRGIPKDKKYILTLTGE